MQDELIWAEQGGSSVSRTGSPGSPDRASCGDVYLMGDGSERISVNDFGCWAGGGEGGHGSLGAVFSLSPSLFSQWELFLPSFHSASIGSSLPSDAPRQWKGP